MQDRTRRPSRRSLHFRGSRAREVTPDVVEGHRVDVDIAGPDPNRAAPTRALFVIARWVARAFGGAGGAGREHDQCDVVGINGRERRTGTVGGRAFGDDIVEPPHGAQRGGRCAPVRTSVRSRSRHSSTITSAAAPERPMTWATSADRSAGFTSTSSTPPAAPYASTSASGDVGAQNATGSRGATLRASTTVLCAQSLQLCVRSSGGGPRDRRRRARVRRRRARGSRDRAARHRSSCRRRRSRARRDRSRADPSRTIHRAIGPSWSRHGVGNAGRLPGLHGHVRRHPAPRTEGDRREAGDRAASPADNAVLKGTRPARSSATTASTTSRTTPRSRTAGTRSCASSSAPSGGASGGRRSPRSNACLVQATWLTTFSADDSRSHHAAAGESVPGR